MKRSLVFLGLLTACGGEGPDDSLLDSADAPVIVGDVDWTGTDTLDKDSAEAKVARSVGYLRIPANSSRCTAWLVGLDTVVTNKHCIADADQAKGAQVSFDYVDSVEPAERTWWDCSDFVGTSDVDLTVLSCAPRNGKRPGEVYGHLTLASADAAEGDDVYIVHQNCDYKEEPGCAPTRKLSRGKVVDASVNEHDMGYDCDTLGGSSGSPVIAASGPNAGKVVALHHLGMGDSDGDGRGSYNGGVRVSVVRDRLARLKD